MFSSSFAVSWFPPRPCFFLVVWLLYFLYRLPILISFIAFDLVNRGAAGHYFIYPPNYLCCFTNFSGFVTRCRSIWFNARTCLFIHLLGAVLYYCTVNQVCACLCSRVKQTSVWCWFFVSGEKKNVMGINESIYTGFDICVMYHT